MSVNTPIRKPSAYEPASGTTKTVNEDKGPKFSDEYTKNKKATFSDKFKATKYELNAFKPKSLEFYGEYTRFKSHQGLTGEMKSNMALSANIYDHDLIKLTFCPPKIKNGKIVSEHYTGWRANEIFHLDAGLGVRTDGDGERDGNPKFTAQLNGETGPLVSIGAKNINGDHPFKITAFNTFKGKYIPVVKAIDGYGNIIKNPSVKENYTNFMGAKATVNVNEKNEFSISGGKFSENKYKPTLAIQVAWKGFLDKKKTFFAFLEGTYLPKDMQRNELRCGAGASLHK